MKDIKIKFNSHKQDAKRRGIDFQLTFEEWYSIWIASGHWEERGCTRGKYVMSRYGDVGPYSVDNVFIQTAYKNNSDAHVWKVGELNSFYGKKHSEESKEKIRATMLKKKLMEETV